MANFDLFVSFLEMLWLHIVLGVTTSPDPLLQKAYLDALLLVHALHMTFKYKDS